MSNKLIILAAVASLLASPVLAASRSVQPSSQHDGSFRIIYMTDLERNEKVPIRAATKAKVKAIQAEAGQNAELVRELRRRGNSVKNIIGTSQTFNGVTIYYVR